MWRTIIRARCNMQGNRAAQEAMERVFEVTDRKWRGVGEISRERLAVEGRICRV